jgi:hypothetical protein
MTSWDLFFILMYLIHLNSHGLILIMTMFNNWQDPCEFPISPSKLHWHSEWCVHPPHHRPR